VSRPKRGADDPASGLYSLPLEDFVKERDALARRLRSDGDREAAEQIRGLKKPSRPAWAINRAVHEDPATAEGLVEAGEQLADAQAEAVSGGGHGGLREAMNRHQQAVEQMVGAVERSVGEQSAALVDRVRETLRAVAGDPELREQFAAGRLTQDHAAAGIGAPAAAGRRPARKPKADGATQTRRREANRKVQQATRSLETAVKRVATARERLERAESAADAARERRDEAEREQAQRERDLADAKAVLEELRES
jgi:hypothetical protein